MSRLICALFSLCLVWGPAEARPALEDQKIQFLIQSIAELKDATFVRNGSDYDAKQAAAHVQMKLRYAGSRVATAEDFITLCATGSSISGQPYKIRFGDGREVASAEFLRDRLKLFRGPDLP